MSNVDEMADLINEYLSNFSQEVTDGIKNGTQIIAKEVNAEIKSHITFKEHSKEYVKAFRIKLTGDSQYNRSYTWHVAKGQYRLTHLLENGHALPQGGRAKEYPHIKFGEELAIRRMEEITREVIENANGR